MIEGQIFYYEAYVGRDPQRVVLHQGQQGELTRAMEAVDLARRIFEAKALLEKYEKTKE